MKHVERQTKTLNSSTCTIIGRHYVYAPLRLFFHCKPGHNTKALRIKRIIIVALFLFHHFTGCDQILDLPFNLRLIHAVHHNFSFHTIPICGDNSCFFTGMFTDKNGGTWVQCFHMFVLRPDKFSTKTRKKLSEARGGIIIKIKYKKVSR